MARGAIAMGLICALRQHETARGVSGDGGAYMQAAVKLWFVGCI